MSSSIRPSPVVSRVRYILIEEDSLMVKKEKKEADNGQPTIAEQEAMDAELAEAKKADMVVE